MMLHILRNPSDPNAVKIIEAQQAQGESPVVVELAGSTDWSDLVEKIFATDATAVW